MAKQIITISRQCGSGGHTIGSKVAKELGIPIYDKKLLEIVAERSGLTPETVKEQGEYAPNSFLYTLAIHATRGYNATDKKNMVLPDQINAFQTELIQELADKESCVIIGRCADSILADRPDCMHVFIHAKLEDRKKRAVEEYGVPEKDAEDHVLARDRKRSQHYKYYTDRVWGMARNYTLCLDSSYWGIDGCVEIIVREARKRMNADK